MKAAAGTAVRIFVTGAGGFIGRHLLARLAKAGHPVTALLLPGERSEGLDASTIVRGDITDAESLKGLVEGCQAVVHLAAAVGYGQTFDRCRRINRDGTENVARVAIAEGARRFIHLSSVSVYGRRPDVPIFEDAPLHKTGDPYGDTKIEAELLLRALAAAGDLDLTILRPTVIYGPGDDKFLPKLMENIRAGRAKIIGPGRNRVDAIFVDDVVEFVALVLEDSRAVGGIYNLNCPDNPSWQQLVIAVAEGLGVPPPRRHIPYPLALVAAGVMELSAWLRGTEPRLTRYAVRVVGRQYHYETARAKIELDFQPGVGLLDGLQRTGLR